MGLNLGVMSLRHSCQRKGTHACLSFIEGAGSALQVINIEDNRNGMLLDPSGYPLPPFIVMERGESLDRWSERAKPDVWQAVSVRLCPVNPPTSNCRPRIV